MNIDRLSDVLNLIPKNKMVYLDLKKSSNNFENSYIKNLESKIVDLLETMDSYDNIIIASFDHNIVRNILKRAIDKKLLFLKTCYICHEFPVEYLESYIRGNDIDYLSVNSGSVSKQLIDICRSNDIELFCYTVNDKNVMDSLIKIGVDGIVSDYPNLIAK